MHERLEQLAQMQQICQEELQQLHVNLYSYSENTANIAEKLKSNWDESDYTLCLYDCFMTSVTNIMNSVRKLSLQIQLHNAKVKEMQSIIPNTQQSSKVNCQLLKENGTHLYPAEEIGLGSDAVEKFVYPKLNLNDFYEKNCIINAIVTYIKDLKSLNFYIFDMSSQFRQTIVNLSTSLELRQYQSIPPPQEIFGYVLDQHIFRAVRSSKFFYDEELGERVFPCYLLDIGEIVTLKSENITYVLIDDQKNTPALGLQCQLHNIKKNPFATEEKLEEQLKKLENNNCQLRVVTVENSVLQVEFVEDCNLLETSKTNQSVLKTVSFKNLPKETNEKRIDQHQLTEEQLEMLNEEPQTTSNAMKAVMGYNPQDDKRICPFYNPLTEACFKGAHCKLEHTLREPDGWTKDILPAASIIDKRTAIVVFPADSIINITPTYVGRSDRFYAQINDTHQTNTPLIWNDEDVPPWMLLQRPPHTFELVLSRYTDGLWYRAKILSHDDDYKMFKILYVDYGNSQVVHLRNLAAIDNGMAQIPHQAVLCRLDGVKENPNISPEERQNCIQMMCETILNKSMDVKVISHYEDLFISFVNKTDYPLPDVLLALHFLEPNE